MDYPSPGSDSSIDVLADGTSSSSPAAANNQSELAGQVIEVADDEPSARVEPSVETSGDTSTLGANGSSAEINNKRSEPAGQDREATRDADDAKPINEGESPGVDHNVGEPATETELGAHSTAVNDAGGAKPIDNAESPVDTPSLGAADSAASEVASSEVASDVNDGVIDTCPKTAVGCGGDKRKMSPAIAGMDTVEATDDHRDKRVQTSAPETGLVVTQSVVNEAALEEHIIEQSEPTGARPESNIEVEDGDVQRSMSESRHSAEPVPVVRRVCESGKASDEM